jgi:hypothetical protein
VAALGGLAFVWDGRLAHDIHVNGVLMIEGLSDNELGILPHMTCHFRSTLSWCSL